MEERFAGQEFVGISIVTENNAANPPVPGDLAAWRDEHGLVGPVVSDPGWGVFHRFFDEAENSGTMLIGPGMDIFIKRETYADSISPEEVEELF